MSKHLETFCARHIFYFKVPLNEITINQKTVHLLNL